jgi:hypothetical protein
LRWNAAGIQRLVATYGRSLTALSIVLALAACVGPARSGDVYRSKGQNSAATTLSAVRTAEFVVHALEEDGLFWPQVSVALAEAADQASTTQQTFASIQPPDASLDRYRRHLDRLLTRAATALGEMRIAARRTDQAGVVAHAAPLEAIATKLERQAGTDA